MKSILWIDDDEPLMDSAEPIFARHGFHVIKAANTSRALTVLRTTRVDGVLLDVQLKGDENGLELLETLKAQYRNVPIVVFAAFPDYEDHVRAQRADASAYFAKIDKRIPLDPGEQRAFFGALHKLFPASGEANTMQSRTKKPGESFWRLKEAAAWIYGGVLLLFLISLVLWNPHDLQRTPQQVVRFLASICGGLPSGFFTGSLRLGVRSQSSMILPLVPWVASQHSLSSTSGGISAA